MSQRSLSPNDFAMLLPNVLEVLRRTASENGFERVAIDLGLLIERLDLHLDAGAVVQEPLMPSDRVLPSGIC